MMLVGIIAIDILFPNAIQPLIFQTKSSVLKNFLFKKPKKL